MNRPFDYRLAKGDTELIAATPEERALLELLGGAGKRNPQTGLLHYYDPDGSGSSHDWGGGSNTDRSDNKAGNDKKGGGGKGSIYDTSRYSGPSYDLPSVDTASRNYQALGDQAYDKWMGEKPDGVGVGDVLSGIFTGGKSIPSSLKKTIEYSKWANNNPKGNYSSGYARDEGYNRHDGSSAYGTGVNGITGTSIGGGGSSAGSGSSAYPSVYTDPITGRLLYESSIPYGTSNKAYKDQLLLDEIMGTDVAKQNVTQNIITLQRQIEDVRARGGDTRWYEQELQRLQDLSGSDVGMDNPLLAYLNSGLREQVMNTQLDNAVANTLRSSEDAAARRGLGTSSMQDKLRASLGLSTAQARNENKLSAQEQDFQARLALMNYLTGDLGQTYQQEMGKTSIPMTFADWENQRAIAETAASTSNSQFDRNMDFLKDQQSDSNRNAWLNLIGDIGGSIDWGSLF